MLPYPIQMKRLSPGSKLNRQYPVVDRRGSIGYCVGFAAWLCYGNSPSPVFIRSHVFQKLGHPKVRSRRSNFLHLCNLVTAYFLERLAAGDRGLFLTAACSHSYSGIPYAKLKQGRVVPGDA